jgi:uncharacterized membrane protein YecN with MAPEG domain
MDVGTAAHAGALWVGLHIFLLLALSLLVVRQRRVHGVALGDGDLPALTRAIRAFGNATEYVPAGMAAIIMLAVVGAPPASVHITGGVMFVGRVVHALSISRSGAASLARAAGVMMTWIAYVFAGVALLFYAIG